MIRYKFYFLVLFFFVGGFSGSAQIHNRMLKFSSGVSYDQFVNKKVFGEINDTSSHLFEHVWAMPVLAYSHEFTMNNVLSFSGRLGYQYLNHFYDHQHFGSQLLYGSANCSISVFYRKGFEYYVKLQAGLVYRFIELDRLEPQMRRQFPENLNLFTGVTLAGFNFFITDKLGLNLELNIWSPEMATFGITYRYFKGELPEIQEPQGEL